MRVLYSAQVRALDEYAIGVLGISGASLMSSAARHIADVACELLPRDGSAVIFAGTGNNGGDGIGAAAELLRRGVSARVFLVGDRGRMTADALDMEYRLREYGGVIESFADNRDIRAFVSGCGVIIDAIFGVGLTRDVEGEALSAINMINGAAVPVVSADIPSGVDADSGVIRGDAIRADVTVTFTAAKPGLLVTPGAVCAGQVRVRDIGIPGEIAAAEDCAVFAVTDGDLALPRRNPDSHKGDYGRVVIVSGSVGFSGAPVLAARAATRTGSGLVTLFVPSDIYQICAIKVDGEMVLPVGGGEAVSSGVWDTVKPKYRSADAAVIGPGLRDTDVVRDLVERALQEKTPLVLDADGINALKANINVLDSAACPVVLTPHDGEFVRIGGDFSAGRLQAARDFAERHNCILVLKGHRTITAMPDGSAFINMSGTPAMAKGGSGDILAGMIASLIGQGVPAGDAAVAAVFLHGKAGEIARSRLGEYSVSPEDIIFAVAEAIKALEE